MEPGLNNGEVVVQASRSAKVVNMNQKVIHKGSPTLAQGCHMRDASIQVPPGPFIAEDLKDAVAEDQETRAGWDLAQASWEVYAAKGAIIRSLEGRRSGFLPGKAKWREHGRRRIKSSYGSHSGKHHTRS